MIKRPMLAVALKDIETDVRFPVLASPKLDGIRCLIVGGKAMTRSLKPIQNRYMRETLESMNLPDGLDGEIMVPGTFQDVASGVMNREGVPQFYYNLFDYLPEGKSELAAEDRYSELCDWYGGHGNEHLDLLTQTRLYSASEVKSFEEDCLAKGFEGTMLRDPKSPYKFGRSTLKEGYLLKLKRMEQSEAFVVGFEEMMHNTNLAQINELGLTKRSSAKAGKVPMGTLGKFLCKDINTGRAFKIGSGVGLTKELRQEFWDKRATLLNKIVTYKWQMTGSKDAPRIPIWLGFRDPSDM